MSTVFKLYDLLSTEVWYFNTNTNITIIILSYLKYRISYALHDSFIFTET